MPKGIAVGRAAAARFLLARQGLLRLSERRPAWQDALHGADGTLTALKRLEAVQIDPVMVLAPNQHLVLRERVAHYAPTWLDGLLAEHRVFEYFANARCFMPIADYPLFAPFMRERWLRIRDEYQELADTLHHVLERIRTEGPLCARQFASDKTIGFWDSEEARTKRTSLALELLWQGGQLCLSQRVNNERFYDLPERVLPPDVVDAGRAMTLAAASEAVLWKYCRAYGLFDLGDTRFGWQRLTAAERRAWAEGQVDAGRLAAVAVEGVKRPYFVLRDEADALLHCAAEGQEARVRDAPDVHLLPPLDNLLWRRERLQDVFGFAYRWEIYTPAAKRQFGSYTMPILMDEVLVGRLEARLNRAESRIEVTVFALEDGVTLHGGQREALDAALKRLARDVGATRVKWLVRRPRG